MSHTPNPEAPKPLLEEEQLPTGTITWVGLGSLALFAAGIWVSNLMLTNETVRQQAMGMPSVPAEIGKPEIGIVDQQLFELEHRDQDERSRQNARLGSYGWVDKEKKVVHVPIEEAMKQVVSEPKK
jgi:hypothetical protein